MVAVRIETPQSRYAATPHGQAARARARKRYNATEKGRAAQARANAARPGDRKAPRVIIGIDGEGQDTPDGRHIYTYLAAVDEHGRLVAEAYNASGLSLDECAAMLLRLPRNSLRFGYMFSYDVTKIIEDMTEADRYYLMRPGSRQAIACASKNCGRPIVNFAAYIEARGCPRCGCPKVRPYTHTVDVDGRSYDYFNGSFTVAENRKTAREEGRKARSIKIWDCFRFFGMSFVEACRAWRVCTDGSAWRLIDPKGPADGPQTTDQLDRVLAMKNKRGSFADESPDEVKAYCREECHMLACLMRAVITAHEKAEIPLKRFEGAGSTATALLRKYEVQNYKGDKHADLPSALQHAVAASFFGGRFENAVIGKVAVPCHGFDLSSAYPYAATFLPCLVHGRWRHVRDLTPTRLERLHNRGALVTARFRVGKLTPKAARATAWLPLPFRSKEGSITYGYNFTGWAWAPELLPALRGWATLVRLHGDAWVYESSCDHQPFGFLPATYRLRCQWGKDGAGIVLKLGPNAVYGKTAQAVGQDPPFQSWPWAGNIPSTTRGQLNDAIASARDRWNVLAVATDGIFARERLRGCPHPGHDECAGYGQLLARDTGTGDLKKPLGGWEHKSVPEGLFLAKPGLYYRLDPELSDIRARGVGRREIFTSRKKLERAFERWDRADSEYHIPLTSRRFFGAKHSILGRSVCKACDKSWPGTPAQRCPACGEVGDVFKTSLVQREDGRGDAYGTWGERTIKVAFDPHPKRSRDVCRGGTYARLHVRDLHGQTSAPYDVRNGGTTPEGELVRLSQEFALEQPDWED